MQKNVSEIKEIMKKIILEESKKDNIDVDLNVFSIIEYYKSPIFKKKLKLSKTNLFKPFKTLGFKTPEGSLILFTNHYSKTFNILMNGTYNKKYQLFKILLTTYHEYGHLYYDKKIYKRDISTTEGLLKFNNNISYEEFIYILDIFNMSFIRYKKGTDYKLLHDFYSFEICADDYSINKTEQYLKDNNIYNDYKDMVEVYKIYTEFRKDIFDIQLPLSKFFNIITISNMDIVPYDNSITEIFLVIDDKEKKYKFRDLKDILKNEKFNSLSKKVQNTILSNNVFLQHLNWDNMNYEEYEVIYEALEYTYNQEVIRKNKMCEFENKINKIIKDSKIKPLLKELNINGWLKEYNINRKTWLGKYYEILDKIINKHKITVKNK